MVYSAFGHEGITLQEYLEEGKPPQDYYEILKSLPVGSQWKDDTFLPNVETSVGDAAFMNVQEKAGPGFTYEWKQPKDIASSPVFRKDNACTGMDCDRFDILQGAVGDCWFMAAINAIVEKKPLILTVVPEDNVLDGRGIFHFRFWKCGNWVEVVVDDLLLCKKSPSGELSLAFSRNRENEFWMPLLEKAYAKLYGSYSAIHGGYVCDALVDLTAGIAINTYFDDIKQDFETITEGLELGSILCLGKDLIDEKPVEYVLDNGIVTGHAYSITGFRKVVFQGEDLTLFSIRNSYANNEWNGAWSDKDENWMVLDPNAVRNFSLDKSNGEFWMSYDDIRTNFDCYDICYFAGDVARALAPNADVRKLWKCHSHSGIWKDSDCLEIDGIARNPQYLLDLRQGAKREVNVLIGLYNKSIPLSFMERDANKGDSKVYLYRLKEPNDSDLKQPVNGAFLRNEKNVEMFDLNSHGAGDPGSDSDDPLMRESMNSMALQSGVYLIIPVCGDKLAVSGKYFLRVYSDAVFDFTKLGY